MYGYPPPLPDQLGFALIKLTPANELDKNTRLVRVQRDKWWLQTRLFGSSDYILYAPFRSVLHFLRPHS